MSRGTTRTGWLDGREPLPEAPGTPNSLPDAEGDLPRVRMLREGRSRTLVVRGWLAWAAISTPFLLGALCGWLIGR